jgi:hypothetical protein
VSKKGKKEKENREAWSLLAVCAAEQADKPKA